MPADHLLAGRQAAASTEPQRRHSAQLFRLFNVTERLHTADWLQHYPLPNPALVTAHHTTHWPPSAADLATWRGSAETALTSPPALEPGADHGGSFFAGPDGHRSLTKLQQVVAANSPTLFPVQELAENPDGATDGPVIIARQRDGYVVLAGNARLSQAQRAGDVDIPVRLATRANLAAARAGAA